MTLIYPFVEAPSDFADEIRGRSGKWRMSILQDAEFSRAVLDSLPTGVCVIERNGKILFWNQGAERIVGFHQHEVIGRHHGALLGLCRGGEDKPCGKACPVMATLHEGKSTEEQTVLEHKQRHAVVVRMRFAPVRDLHGSIVAVAANFYIHNQTSNRENRRPVAPACCTDEATGLANHDFTEFHLRENLAAFAEYHVPFGIILIRADQLQQFRAKYGRKASDSILQVIAQDLNQIFRPGDFIGRWDEDKFLVILANCEEIGVRKAFERIQKLIHGASISWWGEQLSATTSLAFASVESGDKLPSLLQRAEPMLGGASVSRAAAASTSSPSDPGR
jgi:diguanylate cyclase (GGDEF)-like protein/PAS domain S-box-containing protein